MLKRFTVLMALVGLVAGLFLPALASAQSTPPSSIIVKLVAGLSDQAQVDVVASNGGILRSSIPALRLHVIDVPAADLAATLARYQADPRVERAEENKVRLSESVPGDPLYADQWALPRIGWDQVFGTVTPTGIAKVAILDTGVDALHPELAGIVVPGTSILDSSGGTTDPSGHGTWLAGIVAAQTGGTAPDGIAGVAYDGVRIMPVTVLNASGEGLDSDVIPFLRRFDARFPAYLLDVEDPTPVMASVDPSWTGTLPATFVYDRKGAMKKRYIGHSPDLEAQVKSLLKP